MLDIVLFANQKRHYFIYLDFMSFFSQIIIILFYVCFYVKHCFTGKKNKNNIYAKTLFYLFRFYVLFIYVYFMIYVLFSKKEIYIIYAFVIHYFIGLMAFTSKSCISNICDYVWIYLLINKSKVLNYFFN
jgi:hypothetical protein